MADANPGDLVRISGAFTDEGGTAADPTTVTLRLRPRRSAAEEETYVYGTDPELEKDSVGNYHLDYIVPALAPDRALVIEYEWQGTGAVQAVEQGSFSAVDRYG